jgi:MFS family permease
MSAVFFAALLYLPQFMTKVLGYSALRAGAGLAPMMGTFAAASFLAGPLYSRLGPKLISSAGAVCIALGIFLLSRLDATDGYVALVPGMIVLGIGIGLFYSSITTAAVTALDPSRSSLGGGIVYMFQVAGGAVGLGLNTAIVTSAAEATLDGLVNGIGDAFRLDAALAALAVVVVVVRRGQPLRARTS